MYGRNIFYNIYSVVKLQIFNKYSKTVILQLFFFFKATWKRKAPGPASIWNISDGSSQLQRSLWDILTPWLELYCNSLPCLQPCFLLMLLTDAFPEVSLRLLLQRSLWFSLFPVNPHSDVFCVGRGQQEQRSDPQTVIFTGEMSVRRKADNFFFPQAEQLR